MINLASQDMKDTIGIQDAGLGQKSNETSGKAIMARQREGDVGMYTYVDNFSRAVRHTGSILVDLIPRIYDTQRMIRIMGEDGAVDLVPINQTQVDPQTGQPKTINDLTLGAYDVVMQAGPGYSTRREEARDGMLELAKMAPELIIPNMLDLIAQAQDWPMADKIAKRSRSLMNPAVLAADDVEEGQPPPQQPPGPEDIAKMADAKTAEANAAAAESKAKTAEAEFKIKDLELGAMLADSILGPEPPPVDPNAPQAANGQQPQQMPQAA
jgi:hypothetical protein